MAWLYQDPQSKNFKIRFRFQGRAYKKSLKSIHRSEAEIVLAGVKRTLYRLENHLLEIPPGADLLTFVVSDGKQVERPVQVPAPKGVTLQQLIDQYVTTNPS